MKQLRNLSTNRTTVSLTKIGPKHQMTIPKEIFERLKLRVGEYLDVRIQGEAISMEPRKLVPKGQAWFYTPEWQRKEEEADGAISRGEVSSPFSSAEELLKHLGKRRKSARR